MGRIGYQHVFSISTIQSPVIFSQLEHLYRSQRRTMRNIIGFGIPECLLLEGAESERPFVINYKFSPIASQNLNLLLLQLVIDIRQYQ